MTGRCKHELGFGYLHARFVRLRFFNSVRRRIAELHSQLSRTPISDRGRQRYYAYESYSYVLERASFDWVRYNPASSLFLRLLAEYLVSSLLPLPQQAVGGIAI